MKRFLEGLQNADESVKKRWLIVLSGIAMLIILVIWAKYFGFIIQQASNAGQENAGGEKFSFWETMKIGASVLWEKIRGAFGGLGRMLGASRSYIIKP